MEAGEDDDGLWFRAALSSVIECPNEWVLASK